MSPINSAYLAHQRRRWMRPDAHRFVRPDWRRFVRPGYEAEFPFDLYERKYRPDQPRVPAGIREGGRWTSDNNTTSSENEGPQVEANDRPTKPAADRPTVLAAWPSNNPPEVPENRPSTSAERTRILKIVAAFVGGSIGRFIAIAAGAYWLYSESANIISYNDPPKTLEELKNGVSSKSQDGYQDHHIVEQSSAEQDKFPRSQIDDDDNLVRIPTYKHREITGWYSRPNQDFDGQSPREYLRARSWEERREVGLFALRKFGVLKP